MEKCESKWENHKNLWENKRKQLSGLLRHQGEKGELPFDPRILENPEDVFIPIGGKFVVAAGMTFEYSRTDRLNKKRKNIFKVTSVDNKEGVAYIEWIDEDLLRKSIELSDISKYSEQFVEVSLTDDAINRIKITSRTWGYSILNELPDKDFFYENLEELKLDDLSYALFRLKDNGSLLISRLSDARDTEKELDLIWPDANDKNLKKELAEMTLAGMRSNGGYSRNDDQLMRIFFGFDWRGVVTEYGQRAIESEVRAELVETWTNIKDDMIELSADPEAQLKNFDSNRSLIRGYFKSATGDMGDNTLEIEKWVDSYFYQTLKPELVEKAQQFRAEQRRIELEEAKNHPDYKEVPDNISEAFSRMGITIRYNNEERLSGNTNRREPVTLEPYSKLLIFDENGKNGKLFDASRTLKSRFDSRWIAGIGGSWGGDKLWWHVPSSTDLQELYEIIA